MDNLEIVIEDNIFVTSTNSIIDTSFYIRYNNLCFPNNKWTDFTFPILEEWKCNLIRVKELKNVNFKLFFHDGPFWLEVLKNDKMELKIECINDRSIKKAEFTIQCDYYEFLKCIYNTLKVFVKILYKNKLNEGEFESIYKQTVLSINEIGLHLNNKK